MLRLLLLVGASAGSLKAGLTQKLQHTASLTDALVFWNQTAHVVLLQVGPAACHLHLKPAQPRHSKTYLTTSVSPAGQGPGLQVFPSSMPDIDCVSFPP